MKTLREQLKAMRIIQWGANVCVQLEPWSILFVPPVYERLDVTVAGMCDGITEMISARNQRRSLISLGELSAWAQRAGRRRLDNHLLLGANIDRFQVKRALLYLNQRRVPRSTPVRVMRRRLDSKRTKDHLIVLECGEYTAMIASVAKTTKPGCEPLL